MSLSDLGMPRWRDGQSIDRLNRRYGQRQFWSDENQSADPVLASDKAGFELEDKVWMLLIRLSDLG